jgi:hypothetical protein
LVEINQISRIHSLPGISQGPGVGYGREKLIFEVTNVAEDRLSFLVLTNLANARLTTMVPTNFANSQLTALVLSNFAVAQLATSIQPFVQLEEIGILCRIVFKKS